jgi:hypothetical protein
MRSKLNEARSHIASEHYSRAVASIQAAVVACGCGSSDLHLGKRACNLGQCVRAIIRSDNDAFEATARGPCSCGFVWPSCARSLHAEAIDELAKCLEQAGRLAAAFSVALGLIRMNLASPIVSLRNSDCPEGVETNQLPGVLPGRENFSPALVDLTRSASGRRARTSGSDQGCRPAGWPNTQRHHQAAGTERLV